jgi:RNA 2',3'-cyclic 3'-phosphodiesterase
MRLFVAVELDQAARVAVASEQARLRRRAADAALTWVAPELMHLTLVFLGHVDDGCAAAIQQAIAAPVPLCPFDLQLGGIGVFPEHGPPRVLWLGARAGAAQAAALQRIIAARVERVGIPAETRPFHPHLTLARWKERAPRSVRARIVHAEAPPVASVHVNRATLFSSTLSNAGPSYTAMTHADLTCP